MYESRQATAGAIGSSGSLLVYTQWLTVCVSVYLTPAPTSGG
jgi:hypothetical protein